MYQLTQALRPDGPGLISAICTNHQEERSCLSAGRVVVRDGLALTRLSPAGENGPLGAITRNLRPGGQAEILNGRDADERVPPMGRLE